jgi:hypothetical protein
MTKSHVVPKEAAAIAKVFDDAYEDNIRAAAQEHTDDAISTLAELASGEDAGGEKIETTPGVRRGAANDLIEHGHTRASGKAVQAAASKGGIHISIIMQGEKPDVVLEATEVTELPEDPPAKLPMHPAAEPPLGPRWSNWGDDVDMTPEESEDRE